MSEKILVPELGESITEATLAKWLKNKGETINADEPVVELETEKAKEAFKKYQWPIIDVTRKSIEETAASIIKIYEIKNQNA